MKNILLLVALFFATQLSYAQISDKANLDLYFQTLENNQKFMGTVSIFIDGNEVYSHSVGYKDVEKSIKNTALTHFRIGSITKTITAVLVFKSIEMEKLDLNQNIKSFFPNFKHAEKITIAQLLSHRSGIGNFTSDAAFQKWRTQVKTEKEMFDIIQNADFDFEPDSMARYSNSNYILLTFILEKIHQKKYKLLVDEFITESVQMSNTYVGSKIDSPKEAFSYVFKQGWLKDEETNMSIPLGSGSIVSTAKDLNMFTHALFSGKLISSESLQKMKSLKDNYGMGLFVPSFENRSGFSHNGGIDGFTSSFLYFPEQKIGITYLSNANNMNSMPLMNTLVQAAFGKPFEIPSFKLYKVESADLDLYLGEYVSDKVGYTLNITRNGLVLQAQPTNQPVFDLEAVDKHKFSFEKRGVSLEFRPNSKELHFKIGGREVLFTKK